MLLLLYIIYCYLSHTKLTIVHACSCYADSTGNMNFKEGHGYDMKWLARMVIMSA